MNPQRRHSGPVAIITYGDTLREYLTPLGLDITDYAERITGAWIFGLVDSLAAIGLHSLVVCFSDDFHTMARLDHRPSGSVIVTMPTPRAYRWLRGRQNVWARNGTRTGAALARIGDVVSPYLRTPARALSRLLRRERAGTILCQEYEHARFDICVGIGKLVGIPVFATFQACSPSTSRVHHVVRRVAMRACAGLLIADRREEDRVLARYRLSPSKVARVPNALNLRDWEPVDRAVARRRLGLADEEYIVAWHGRLELDRKGLDILLDACRRLSAMELDRPLRLLIIGTGEEAPDLRELLRSYDKPAVTWRDEFVLDTAEIALHLSAADVYAFPSRREGFPVSPLEAMACGLPLVATDCEGMREMLPEGQRSGGVIVPLEDAEALAQALCVLLSDADLRLEIGRAGRRRVEEAFTVEAVGHQLASVLMAGQPPFNRPPVANAAPSPSSHPAAVSRTPSTDSSPAS